MKESQTFILSPEERKQLQLLKKRLQQEPAADYRIAVLVKASGMNRTKLHKGFLFLFGSGIHAYLLEQRLKTAQRLLKQTDLPIKAVAVQSGFKQEKYFFRYFKQKTFYTPAGYRKRFKK
ncbi:MAG: helix-turn-helix transcriptional regulator [Lacibacter sp.]|jgi:transcriptional regulator GlxA family with amidase domain